MPKNISKVYQELNIFSVYVKGSVVSIGLVISSNINKWLKALLTNTVFIKVALLGINSSKAIR